MMLVDPTSAPVPTAPGMAFEASPLDSLNGRQVALLKNAFSWSRPSDGPLWAV